MGRAQGDDLETLLMSRPGRHLVHHRMRFRSGELLFQRRGHLNPVRQDINGSFCLERAPRRRGIWAFPWPWSEPFFSQHKFLEAMPKHLLYETGNELWREVEARYRPLLAVAKGAELRRLQQQMFDEFEPIAEKQEAEREKWIRTHGRKHVPLKSFWYGGELYTHLDRRGECQGMSEWVLLSAAEFYRAARHHERREANRDVLEVFIPASGKLR